MHAQKSFYFLIFLIVSIVGILNIHASTPNVILIVADDLGYGDLSVYGQSKYTTPNIDQLAKDGLLFSQHYAGAPVCAPSRSALLTAKHTGHTTIRGNKKIHRDSDFPLSNHDTTLIHFFKSAHYVTGVFGKWGVGGPESTTGIDHFVGYYGQLRAHDYYPTYLWNNREKILFPENKHFRQQTYAPHVIHDSLMAFIDRNKQQPFFIYMPTLLPHAELVPPRNLIQNHLGLYDDEKAYKGIKTIKIARKFGAYGKQYYPKAAFAAMITLLDQQIGEIVKKLKDVNLYDNTIIIFTSDNGPHREGGAQPQYFRSAQSFKGIKRDLYEGGIRVPLIVHWSQQIQSGETDILSANWDLFPTLADILQLGTPKDIDGISLLPTIHQSHLSQIQHEYLYWEFHEQGGKQALREGNWKLVRLNIQHQKKTTLELYNIFEDPNETQNLASKYPEIVKNLLQKMKNARTPSKDFPLGID